MFEKIQFWASIEREKEKEKENKRDNLKEVGKEEDGLPLANF